MIRDQFIMAALAPANQSDLASAEIEFRLVRLHEGPYKFGIVSFDVRQSEDDHFRFGPRHRTIGYAPLWHFSTNGKSIGYGVFFVGFGRSKDQEFDAVRAEEVFHELLRPLRRLISQHRMLLGKLLEISRKSGSDLKLNFLRDGIDLLKAMELKSPFDLGLAMPGLYEKLRGQIRTRFQEQLFSYAMISHFHNHRRPLPSFGGKSSFYSLKELFRPTWMYANDWNQSILPLPTQPWKLVAKIEFTKELQKANPESYSPKELYVQRARLLLRTYWSLFGFRPHTPFELASIKGTKYKHLAYAAQWIPKRNRAKVREFEGRWLEDVGIDGLQTILRWETGHSFAAENLRRMCSELHLISLVKKGRKQGKLKR